MHFRAIRGKRMLYELRNCYDIYCFLQNKIARADQKIEELLTGLNAESEFDPPRTPLAKKQTKGKNQPRFNLSLSSYQYYGVGLMAIDSISSSTVLALYQKFEMGYTDLTRKIHEQSTKMRGNGCKALSLK